MVDESTDISTTKHLIMYASFLESQKVITCFLGISKVVDGTAASIYDAIVEKVKEYELDTNKFVAFGSDGASVMTGRNTGVATRLRNGINPFMINIHCVAHRTNLCLESASKVSDCEDMCTFVDKLVNKIASYFSRSTIRLNLLAEMEKELEYDELKAQDIQETRWLSRHRAIKRLCEILEPILEVLKKENAILYDSLRDFKVIYVLHYLGDILQKMTDLSLDFQRDNVDVTTVWSLCNATVKEIETEYLGLHADLNGNNYDSKGYPIIPDYGSSDGLLFALRSAVKGNMYRGVEMKRSSTDWVGKSFADAWTMISCMDTWAMKYPELLKVAQFGLVQCCSTAACERGFSRVNMIKVKYRNQLKSPAVEALVRISIEGPSLETFDVSASIKHWRTCAKFRHIDTGTCQEIQSDGEDEQVTFPSNIEEIEVDIEDGIDLNLLDFNKCS